MKRVALFLFYVMLVLLACIVHSGAFLAGCVWGVVSIVREELVYLWHRAGEAANKGRQT